MDTMVKVLNATIKFLNHGIYMHYLQGKSKYNFMIKVNCTSYYHYGKLSLYAEDNNLWLTVIEHTSNDLYRCELSFIRPDYN